MSAYRVRVGGRWIRFATLEGAQAFAGRVFARFGIVVGIEVRP